MKSAKNLRELCLNRKKTRKKSDLKVQKRFEMLMNNGGDIEYEMRLMDSKLRKINKECSKPKKIEMRPILKVKGVSRRKNRVKLKVAFDLQSNDSFY